MAARRDVSPIIQKIRNFLLGRKNVNHLRFADDLSARTQPPPNLPEGPSHKLSGNYYYTRDGRRLVKPEEVILVNSEIKQLGKGDTECVSPTIARVPGKVHLWDK